MVTGGLAQKDGTGIAQQRSVRARNHLPVPPKLGLANPTDRAGLVDALGS